MIINFQIKNFLMFVVALLVGVVLGLSLIYLTKQNKTYYAVFLNNGQIYFGKLSTFPKLKLDDPIFIQVDNQNNISLQRFKNVFWMPKGQMYLNRDSILFIAPIAENSPLINFIENTRQQIQQPSSLQPIQQLTPRSTTTSQQ